MSRSPYSRTYSHYYIRNYVTFEHPLFLRWYQSHSPMVADSTTAKDPLAECCTWKFEYVESKMRRRNETLLTAKSFYLLRMLNLKRFLKVKVRIVLYNASLLKQQHCCWFRKSMYCMSHWRRYCVFFDDALCVECRIAETRYAKDVLWP